MDTIWSWIVLLIKIAAGVGFIYGGIAPENLAVRDKTILIIIGIFLLAWAAVQLIWGSFSQVWDIFEQNFKELGL